MMEAWEASSGILLQRPWLPVNISGCHLLAKSWFGDTAYHILLTDMHCVWEERMVSAAIQKRAQELNKRLRAPVQAFFSHLCEVVQPTLTGSDGRPTDEALISLTKQEDGNVNMRLKSELAGLPLYWEFHCTPAPVTVVCVQLVRPLLLMSHLLQQQVDQLGGLLVKKDAEIQDYRENGATLSRERLQTDFFEEQTNREDFMAKTLPLLPRDTLTFDADLQRLYAAVVTHGATRKRRLSETCFVEEERPSKEPNPDVNQVGSVRSEPDEAEEQNQTRKLDGAAAKTADRPSVKQSAQATSDPAERPSSKPKKKKVGLFR
ncbi:non-homologous end-joining factor 1 [Xyrichtys novacula]|uniref:Non-homologous end-joining factor 1 n=1 Tax=Xyrichtys novacula TaxID=13765 RepID=A0AAV1HQ26_XYRNO|nr:non-homologous end-joining factor 1 [Xyrichtys novacula]